MKLRNRKPAKQATYMAIFITGIAVAIPLFVALMGLLLTGWDHGYFGYALVSLATYPVIWVLAYLEEVSK